MLSKKSTFQLKITKHEKKKEDVTYTQGIWGGEKGEINRK